MHLENGAVLFCSNSLLLIIDVVEHLHRVTYEGDHYLMQLPAAESRLRLSWQEMLFW